MSRYTTGEIAKLCDVSVRTVQFYDTKDLLKPTELTEGGRRLYSEEDMKKLRLICLLKALGLSLDAIKGVLDDRSPAKILLLLLQEQEKEISCEIASKQRQLQVLQAVRDSIASTDAIPTQTISDIEHMMNSKKKLRRVHGAMLGVGLVMTSIEIGTVLLWILKGIWWPFAIGMPVVILMGVLLTRMYHRNTAYICPECNAVFTPTMRQILNFQHTPKTRKLKCPSCGRYGYCVEVARVDKA